jgi:hypothetical protein
MVAGDDRGRDCRYMLSKFGDRSRAQSAFVGVLNKMREASVIHAHFVSFVHSLDANTVDPLLLEIIK